jgi:transposase
MKKPLQYLIAEARGKDSALRQWGLHLAARGGKQARNKAVVAVARELAVLLHRIWVTQEP